MKVIWWNRPLPTGSTPIIVEEMGVNHNLKRKKKREKKSNGGRTLILSFPWPWHRWKDAALCQLDRWLWPGKSRRLFWTTRWPTKQKQDLVGMCFCSVAFCSFVFFFVMKKLLAFEYYDQSAFRMPRHPHTTPTAVTPPPLPFSPRVSKVATCVPLICCWNVGHWWTKGEKQPRVPSVSFPLPSPYMPSKVFHEDCFKSFSSCLCCLVGASHFFQTKKIPHKFKHTHTHTHTPPHTHTEIGSIWSRLRQGFRSLRLLYASNLPSFRVRVLVNYFGFRSPSAWPSDSSIISQPVRFHVLEIHMSCAVLAGLASFFLDGASCHRWWSLQDWPD